MYIVLWYVVINVDVDLIVPTFEHRLIITIIIKIGV